MSKESILSINNKEIQDVYEHHYKKMKEGSYDVSSFIDSYNSISQANMDENKSSYFYELGKLVFEFFYQTDGDTRPKDSDSLHYFLEFFIIMDMCHKKANKSNGIMTSFLMT